MFREEKKVPKSKLWSRWELENGNYGGEGGFPFHLNTSRSRSRIRSKSRSRSRNCLIPVVLLTWTVLLTASEGQLENKKDPRPTSWHILRHEECGRANTLLWKGCRGWGGFMWDESQIATKMVGESGVQRGIQGRRVFVSIERASRGSSYTRVHFALLFATCHMPIYLCVYVCLYIYIYTDFPQFTMRLCPDKPMVSWKCI